MLAWPGRSLGWSSTHRQSGSEHLEYALDLVIVQGRAAGQGNSTLEDPLCLTVDKRTMCGEDRLQVHGLPQAPGLDVLGGQCGDQLLWPHPRLRRVQIDAGQPAVVLVVGPLTGVVPKEAHPWNVTEGVGVHLADLTTPREHAVESGELRSADSTACS